MPICQDKEGRRICVLLHVEAIRMVRLLRDWNKDINPRNLLTAYTYLNLGHSGYYGDIFFHL